MVLRVISEVVGVSMSQVQLLIHSDIFEGVKHKKNYIEVKGSLFFIPNHTLDCDGTKLALRSQLLKVFIQINKYQEAS